MADKTNKGEVKNQLFIKVKKLLAEKGSTFGELAEYVGLTPSGLRNGIENRKIFYDKAVLMSNFFGVELKFLMDDDVNDPLTWTRITQESYLNSALSNIKDGVADDLLNDLVERLFEYQFLLNIFFKKYPEDKITLECRNIGNLYFTNTYLLKELIIKIDKDFPHDKILKKRQMMTDMLQLFLEDAGDSESEKREFIKNLFLYDK